MNSKEIAQTIYNQLGGSRFSVMTGAKNFTIIDNGLRFSLPKMSGIQVNRVMITLTPADVYHVDFVRAWGNKFTFLASVDDVYCDQLCEVFEANTGLMTSL